MLVLSLLSLLSLAQAADAKIYPGSMCRRADTTADTWLDGSRLFNNASSAITVDCPVVRDNTSSISSSYLYVLDYSSTANISCTLVNQSLSSASSYYWSSTVSSSSATTTHQKLTTGAPSSSISSGYLFFSCSVPAASGSSYSGIAGYYVNET